MIIYRNHENLQLGDSMIRQLESHGLQMAREKQDYYGIIICKILSENLLLFSKIASFLIGLFFNKLLIT